MNKAEKGMTQKTAAKKPKKELTAKDISLGDAVKVLSMNLKGTVSSRPDNKGFLFVQMGIIRSKVHISDLELIDEAEITTPTCSVQVQVKSACQKQPMYPQRSTCLAKR